MHSKTRWTYIHTYLLNSKLKGGTPKSWKRGPLFSVSLCVCLYTFLPAAVTILGSSLTKSIFTYASSEKDTENVWYDPSCKQLCLALWTESTLGFYFLEGFVDEKM